MKIVIEVDTGDDFDLEPKMYHAWCAAQIYKVDQLMKRTGLEVTMVRSYPQYSIRRNGSVMDYTHYDIKFIGTEEGREVAEKHEEWSRDLRKKVDEEIQLT